MAEYSEYKDSGIPWIGKIPSHWDVKPIRSFLSQSKELNEDENATLLTLSQYKGVNIRNGNEDSAISAPESLVGYNVVHKGQFVMNIMLAWNGSYGVSDYEGVISPAYAIFNFKNDVCKAYYHYLWRTKAYQDAFKTRSKGIVDSRLRLYPQYFLPFYTSIPPKDEQEAIVAYLDKVTADIDKAIAAKERIIASLEERRKIIITHAVTRGINPNAPLKGSGIDWHGDIPAHWEVIRIKYLLNEKKVRSKTGAEEPLSMSQRKGLIPTKMMGVIPNLAASYVDAKLVSKGDLVFNKLKAHLGVFNVSEYEGLVSPDYAVYNTTGKADLKFLEYVFKTPNCINEFKKLITGVGSGLSRLYTNDLYSIYCAIPPIDEQLSIRNHIVNQTKAISEAIDQCQSIIDLLRERKNIIINETVTGKVKVI
ncbi:MAG: restriction endonuclease subunit S [Clostridia bacterium]|nr:restriction endonuclease subunit S [Clostridia bacterium]